MIEIVPMTLEDAEAFLAKHQRHYVAPAKKLCAIGVKGEDGLHGAAVLGMREDGDAELAHIYVDGVSQGYTMLYGACWRALKALGFKKTAL